MLKITVQKLGDIHVLRCHGRIVAGDAGSILRSALLSQRHIRMLVIDLAQVERIDAALGLRQLRIQRMHFDERIDVDVADPNLQWNRWFAQIPAAGDYGTQKLFVMRKV